MDAVWVCVPVCGMWVCVHPCTRVCEMPARELVWWWLGTGVSPVLLVEELTALHQQLEYKQALKPWTRAPDIFFSLEFKDEK